MFESFVGKHHIIRLDIVHIQAEVTLGIRTLQPLDNRAYIQLARWQLSDVNLGSFGTRCRETQSILHYVKT